MSDGNSTVWQNCLMLDPATTQHICVFFFWMCIGTHTHWGLRLHGDVLMSQTSCTNTRRICHYPQVYTSWCHFPKTLPRFCRYSRDTMGRTSFTLVAYSLHAYHAVANDKNLPCNECHSFLVPNSIRTTSHQITLSKYRGR